MWDGYSGNQLHYRTKHHYDHKYEVQQVYGLQLLSDSYQPSDPVSMPGAVIHFEAF